jgi:hypothetical protein
MIEIKLITPKEFSMYELSEEDILPIARYGRSVKAFKTNRLRAEATRMIERRLNMNQRQFAQVEKSERLSMVRAMTRVLVNQMKIRYKIKTFKNIGV